MINAQGSPLHDSEMDNLETDCLRPIQLCRVVLGLLQKSSLFGLQSAWSQL